MQIVQEFLLDALPLLKRGYANLTALSEPYP